MIEVDKKILARWQDPNLSNRQLEPFEAEAMLAAAQVPSLMLVKTAYDTSPGTPGCWLGGDPTLSPDIPWPWVIEQDRPLYPQHFIAAFESALSKIEDRLSLSGQPRAIVFHEKEGRRHCHAVWLRVDISRMRAINLPYFKLKLRDQSRELFLEHGWKMPKGLENSNDRDPLNYSLAEWQQSKRAYHDPKALKATFQECWERSDDVKAFAAALEQNGFHLAKGDRRGHVAVDPNGNVFAISRTVGIGTRIVRDKLGEPDYLPRVDEAHAILRDKIDDHLQRLIDEQAVEQAIEEREYTDRLLRLRQSQRQERDTLNQAGDKQRRELIRHHSDQLPKGFKAIWFRVTGRYSKIKLKIERAMQRQGDGHNAEKEKLIRRQLLERQDLQKDKRLLWHKYELLRAELRAEMLGGKRGQPERGMPRRSRHHSR